MQATVELDALVRSGDADAFARLSDVVFTDVLTADVGIQQRVLDTIRAVRDAPTLKDAAAHLALRRSNLDKRMDVTRGMTTLDPLHPRDRLVLELSLLALETTGRFQAGS